MAIATQQTEADRPTFNPALLTGAQDSPPPTPHRRSRLFTVLPLAAVLAAGAGLAWKSGWSPIGESRVATPLHRVSRTKLPITFSARGTLESGKNRDVINRVEGQTTILFIIPDGSIVKEGDLVCELDSAPLRDRLTTQRITVQQAEADVQAATKTREVAEFALREYEGGTYPQTKQDADIALKLAETNLEQAAERFDWSDRMFGLGFVARSQTIADRDSKTNSEITLERSKGKIALLEGYTRRKKIIELTASVTKARSDELAKQAKFALEETKQKKYETLIGRCKMTAPIAGLITHNNESSMRMGSSQEMVQEGTAVREGQVLIKIPDVSAMRVNAKLDESIVSRVNSYSKARIQIDAFSGMTLDGNVTAIQTMSDPVSREFPELRLYTALVQIQGAPTSLRPGMAARVELLVSEADDVLAIPTDAVLQVGSESFVYVEGLDGPARRGVMLGGGNGKLVEIIEGITEGEQVSLNPMALMTEQEKQAAFSTVSSSPRNDWR